MMVGEERERTEKDGVKHLDNVKSVKGSNFCLPRFC